MDALPDIRPRAKADCPCRALGNFPVALRSAGMPGTREGPAPLAWTPAKPRTKKIDYRSEHDTILSFGRGVAQQSPAAKQSAGPLWLNKGALCIETRATSWLPS